MDVFVAFADGDDDDGDGDISKVVPSVARSFIYEPLLLQRFLPAMMMMMI